jgi:hypothetical protein
MQKNKVMKFTPESFKKFVLEEVKKIAIENKWINEDSFVKIKEVETPIQSKEEILKESAEDIKETKMLSEELRRMKQLLDFRNIVNKG